MNTCRRRLLHTGTVDLECLLCRRNNNLLGHNNCTNRSCRLQFLKIPLMALPSQTWGDLSYTKRILEKLAPAWCGISDIRQFAFLHTFHNRRQRRFAFHSLHKGSEEVDRTTDILDNPSGPAPCIWDNGRKLEIPFRRTDRPRLQTSPTLSSICTGV